MHELLMYEIQVITAAGLPAGFVWINNQRADQSGHVTEDAERSDTKPAGKKKQNPQNNNNNNEGKKIEIFKT